MTLSGRDRELSNEHPENAYLPMIFMVLGIVTETKFVQSSNANPSIVVICSLITTFFMSFVSFIQGGCSEKSISPIPVMVSVPLSKTHLQSFPHDPLSATQIESKMVMRKILANFNINCKTSKKNVKKN